MDLKCPVQATSVGTSLQWRRIEGELLVSGDIDESSSHHFAEALESLARSDDALSPGTDVGTAFPPEPGIDADNDPVASGPAAADRQWLVDLRSTRLLAAAGVTILVRWLRSLEDGDEPPPRVRILPSDTVGWVLHLCRLGDTVAFCDVEQNMSAGSVA